MNPQSLNPLQEAFLYCCPIKNGDTYYIYFGKYLQIELSSDDFRMLYIPPGFAHGFSAMEDSVFQYKCTAPYSKISEGGINPIDSTLAIDWHVDQMIVSEKDLQLSAFNEIKFPF